MKGYVSSKLGSATFKGKAQRQELKTRAEKGSAVETGRKLRDIHPGSPVLMKCKEVWPIK